MRNLIRALIATLSLATLPVVSQAGVVVGVSVGIAPPALPVYVQPPCPTPGYIWIPGYWAWDDGYYWVPGTWALAPAVGLLWTPGYWGWGDGVYVWHEGYWGPHVGFYGGINYGFGYGGVGYEGGYWRGHEFFYNRAVTNVRTTNITNVYNRTVVNNVSHVSFNGGTGGVRARPSAAEIAAGRESHRGLTPMQRQQAQVARTNTSLRAAHNGGHPAIAATQRPGAFSGHGVVAARGAERPASRTQTADRLQTTDRSQTANRTQTANRATSGVIERPATPAARSDHPSRTDRPASVGGAGPGHDSTPRLAAARPPAPRSESAPPSHVTYPPEHRSYQAAPHSFAPAPHPMEHAPAYTPRPAPQGASHERAAPERPEHGERGL